MLVSVSHFSKSESNEGELVMLRENTCHLVLPAMLKSAPQLLSVLQSDSVKACFLTMHARGRRDSHRQNMLVLASSASVFQTNPVPPAAGDAGRWAFS